MVHQNVKLQKFCQVQGKDRNCHISTARVNVNMVEHNVKNKVILFYFHLNLNFNSTQLISSSMVVLVLILGLPSILVVC